MKDFVPKITLKQALILRSEKKFYRRKRLIHLHFQGYSNQKIAQKLGYCLSTIEKDLHEIRKNLRRAKHV